MTRPKLFTIVFVLLFVAYFRPPNTILASERRGSAGLHLHQGRSILCQQRNLFWCLPCSGSNRTAPTWHEPCGSIQ